MDNTLSKHLAYLAGIVNKDGGKGLWDVITALRGPDSPSEIGNSGDAAWHALYDARRKRKYKTTEVIRAVAGLHGGAARFHLDDHVIVPPSEEQDHFDKHVVKAATALGIKIIYRSDKAEGDQVVPVSKPLNKLADSEQQVDKLKALDNFQKKLYGFKTVAPTASMPPLSESGSKPKVNPWDSVVTWTPIEEATVPSQVPITSLSLPEFIYPVCLIYSTPKGNKRYVVTGFGKPNPKWTKIDVVQIKLHTATFMPVEAAFNNAVFVGLDEYKQHVIEMGMQQKAVFEKAYGMTQKNVISHVLVTGLLAPDAAAEAAMAAEEKLFQSIADGMSTSAGAPTPTNKETDDVPF